MGGRRSLPQTPVPEIVEDEKAASESFSLAKGLDLSDQKTLNAIQDLKRENSAKEHMHIIKIAAVYLGSIAALVMVGTLVLHYILPAYVLTPDQAGDLQKFLLSGGAGAFLKAGYSKILK